jgi:hypothetical protein
MHSVKRRRPGHSLAWVLVSLVAAALLPACNQSNGERQDQIEQTTRLPNKVQVAKFAGHVSVDGQPPSPDSGTLFVILNDPQHLVAGGKTSTTCDDQGNFGFTTYLPADGAPTGKYVVTFVQLKAELGAVGHGRRMGGLSMTAQYAGPDGLKNLYSDPEKNKDDPKFAVEIAEPGRTDYDFNLEVAGMESIKTPGPFAATRLRTNINPKL